MTSLGVFVVYMAIDFVWARYTHHMMVKNAKTAGFLAAVIVLLAGVGTIGFTTDHWLLIPAMAGAFAGTWIATCDTLHNLVRAVRRGRPSGGRATRQ